MMKEIEEDVRRMALIYPLFEPHIVADCLIVSWRREWKSICRNQVQKSGSIYIA